MRCLADLDTLADDVPGARRDNFRQLVGYNANLRATLPDERSGWRFLHPRGGVCWLRRNAYKPPASEALLPPIAVTPFCGKKGNDWVRAFSTLHGDVGLKGDRLQTLAKVGSVSSNGERSKTYRGWMKVEQIEITEAHIEALPHVPAPSLWAKLRGQVRSMSFLSWSAARSGSLKIGICRCFVVA